MRGMDTNRKCPPTEASGQGTASDSKLGFIAVALLLASGLVAWLVMAWG